MTGCWLPSARTPPRRRVRDSLDLAQVGLEFSTSGLARGETAALSTFTKVEQGAQRAQSATAAIGPAFNRLAQEQVKAAQTATATAQQTAFLQSHLVKLGMTTEQAAAAMKQMNVAAVQLPTSLAAA